MPKLSDFIFYLIIVAAGFSLRFLMGARKFRNLKVAATESLNLGKTNVRLSATLLFEGKTE